MKLTELERSLPNGLHDAELVGVHVDLDASETTLRLNIDVSASDTDGASDAVYRPARLVFAGTAFVVIDPPAGDL